MTKVCICGGGSLGHVMCGYLSSMENYSVSLLTGHPHEWSRHINVIDPYGKEYKGKLEFITSDAEQTARDTDIILLCLPGFAIEKALIQIAPFIKKETYIGSIVSSTGFFLMANNILPKATKLFGFQRVPFISRTEKYGHSARILGYKSSLSIGTLNVEDTSVIQKTAQSIFNIPVKILDNYLQATLSNSNPLLHPCRLYSMFKNNGTFERPIKFYEDWDDSSSRLLIACDSEFQSLIKKMGLEDGSIPPLLEYYESEDEKSLTNKIRSIKAFEGLLAPMVKNEDNEYVPDFRNRYFTEDIPFGMAIIKTLAVQNNIDTPNMDMVLAWASNIFSRYIPEATIDIMEKYIGK